MAEQLICNQQVGGSSPFTSSSNHHMMKAIPKIVGVILFCGLAMKPANVLNKGSTDEYLDTLVPKFEIPQELTVYAVKQACMYYNLLHPEIVVAQSILETGYYTSRVCKDYNNILGLYDSANKDYFKFKNWWDSVEGYKNLVQYKLGKDSCTVEEYYTFLRELPYATDPEYINKIHTIVSRHQTSDEI